MKILVSGLPQILLFQEPPWFTTGVLEQLIFSIEVEGVAGQALPKAAGQLDGASVLGYVFPTTLQPTDVGGTGY
ncbi:MAG: hypothetical protein AAFN81_23090 [Bacteroidota bacterium]